MPAFLYASAEANLALRLDLSALSTEVISISAFSGCPSEDVTLIPPKPAAQAMPDIAMQAM
jgi:hypothetical protein